MAIGSGDGSSSIRVGGTPTGWTPERLADLPLGLLREKAYQELGPDASLRLLSEYQRALDQAPEETKKHMDTRTPRIKGTLGGVAIGVVAGLGVAVGLKNSETHSLIFLTTTALTGGLLGFAIGDARAARKHYKNLADLERQIDEEHRNSLAAALTDSQLDAIYLQASTLSDR